MKKKIRNKKINGMAIALTIGSIFPNSNTFDKVFATPSIETPNPNEILPTNLIRWPKDDKEVEYK